MVEENYNLLKTNLFFVCVMYVIVRSVSNLRAISSSIDTC